MKLGKWTILPVIIFSVLIGLGPISSQAQSNQGDTDEAVIIKSNLKPIYFTPNVPIGDFQGTLTVGPDLLGKYFQIWYGFTVGAVGIIATVIIMWGGFKWLTSRGNPRVISDAKEWIWGAVIGLVLVFLSYSILNIINPRLLTISLPNLSVLDVPEPDNLRALRTDEPQGQDFDSRYETAAPLNTQEQSATVTDLAGNNINVATGVRVDNLTEETLNIIYQLQEDFGNDITITSGYRPGSITTGGNPSQHSFGRAVDLRRTPEFDTFMRDEVIGEAAPRFYYHDQPGYYVSYQGVPLVIIDESINNTWHIDTRLIDQ